ncbi:MAG: hypothetical protein R3C61_01500 [Bacteroidia bacterium]
MSASTGNTAAPLTIAQIEANNNRKLTADKIRQILTKVRNNPKQSARRWVWELAQNAKDVPNSRFDRIAIQIILESNRLTFAHNGDPFSMQNIMSLIQQVSSKDSANEDESVTGKFGTGFIATHLLSEIIHVEGVVEHWGGFKRFNIVLDRSDEKSEDMMVKIGAAIDHVRGIEGDSADFPVIQNYEAQRKADSFDTKFIYPLDRDSSREAAQAGLDDLIHTLPQTLVFNPSIASVEVINQVAGQKETYVCHPPEPQTEKITRYQIEIKQTDGTTEKVFFTHQSENCCLVAEVEKDALALVKPTRSQPVLFRDFPLIGSERFFFPLALNGLKFNPTEDRNGIYLHDAEGKQAIENRGYIKEAGDAYMAFSEWLIDAGASNRFVLAQTRLPKEEWEQFSKDWYKGLQAKWRGWLLEKPMVETADEGFQILKNTWIPIYGDKREIKEAFYELCVPFYGAGSLPQKELLHEWIDALGPKDEWDTWGKRLDIGLEDLVKQVASKENLSALAADCFQDESTAVSWLNTLYQFCHEQTATELLTKYKLVPNLYGLFFQLDKLHQENKDEPMPDEFLAIYHQVFPSDDWREKVIHREVILPTQNLQKLGMSDLSKKVNEEIRKIAKTNVGQRNLFLERKDARDILIEILRYFSLGSQMDNIQAQVFSRAKQVWKFDQEPQKISGLEPFSFIPALELLVQLLHDTIQSFKTINAFSIELGLADNAGINWLNTYLNLIAGSSSLKDMLEYGNIVPARNGQLVAFEAVHDFGTDETPLNDELLGILSRLDPKQNWFGELPAQGLTLKFKKTKKFSDLGEALDHAVKGNSK